MKHNVAAPTVGESISEVSILKWAKENGQYVKTGELLLEIESDKATVEIVAEVSGQLAILKPAGERIPVGELIATIDDSVAPGASHAKAEKKPESSQTSAPQASALPASSRDAGNREPGLGMGPAARKALAESGISPQSVQGTGKEGRITVGDIRQAREAGTAQAPAKASASTSQSISTSSGPTRRVPMSNLRARIAERLVQAQHTAAILTTFNEVDMSPVMSLRNQHKDAFKAKHGVALSFMSFFTRAAVESLKAIPEVNAAIDGRDVIYHDYCDIGIAVGSDRGLVVPVVRNAQTMGFVEIEKKIAELAVKARDGKLSVAEMSGGTFTISNGGVYGSLLSTPILNPPQSGILGMHKIQERPIAIQGKVEVRPMMYLALSYDHRLIDGKGAVTFLVTLKDFLEHPEKLSFEY